MLDKPSHLQPEAGGSTWLAARPASAITAVLGLLVFIIAAVTSSGIGSMPDFRLPVPGLLVLEANQVLLWSALAATGARGDVSGYGRLF